MAFQEEDLSGAAPVGQAGAALFQKPAEATEEWEESHAEDAPTTLSAVPAKALWQRGGWTFGISPRT